ncbi:MAG: PQQ-dependent sugar dehydrogenase [Chitinophagaceae bacterium]|nr:PQQ-dependent sugar dehydrogenase [Chitinophagaceae bacterium]
MKKLFVVLLFALLTGLIFFNSCNSIPADKAGNIASDSLTIAKGKGLFRGNCSPCHNFIQDGIGPRLSGVTAVNSAEWIKRFIKDPNAVIASGDERAKKLFEQFHTVMPSFATYPDDDLDAIVAYLHTEKAPEKTVVMEDGQSLKDPIPEAISLSGVEAGLELVTQIPASSEEKPITRITKMEAQPGTGQLFIVELRGVLYRIQDNQPAVYMDMRALRPAFIDKPGMATGFGSFAFHPEFEKNGLLYTTHTELPEAIIPEFKYDDSIKRTVQWVLTEWKVDNPRSAVFAGKGRELFRVNMVTGIHGMQDITFNPYAKRGDKDYGLLYIGVGDGGCVDERLPQLTHRLDRILGAILRIDPRGNNSANGKYGIPADNPFVNDGDPNTLGEIYAYGFRNPHRITWTRSGLMLSSNIGSHNIESLNIILPGHDYGWPLREGDFVLKPLETITKVYALPEDDAIYNITYPAARYDHGEGNAISGGFEYLGSASPQLAGKYVFGDIANGRLFYVNINDLKLGSRAPIREWQVTFNGKKTTLLELCKKNKVDLRFGRDAHGEIYLWSKQDGKVYKVVNDKKTNV